MRKLHIYHKKAYKKFTLKHDFINFLVTLSAQPVHLHAWITSQSWAEKILFIKFLIWFDFLSRNTKGKQLFPFLLNDQYKFYFFFKQELKYFENMEEIKIFWKFENWLQQRFGGKYCRSSTRYFWIMNIETWNLLNNKYKLGRSSQNIIAKQCAQN